MSDIEKMLKEIPFELVSEGKIMGYFLTIKKSPKGLIEYYEDSSGEWGYTAYNKDGETIAYYGPGGIMTEEEEKFKAVIAEETSSTITSNEIEIITDDDFKEHMQAHPEINWAIICNGVSKINFEVPNDTISFSKKLYTINSDFTGLNYLVETTKNDKIKMEVRPNRTGATPIVYGREAEETNKLNIVIATINGKHYLITAFYGDEGCPEPWEEHLTPEEKENSKKYWSCHALIKKED